MNTGQNRDHGGELGAAMAQYGGNRTDWIDLSTGINPVPYPVAPIAPEILRCLPDQAATGRLERAAREFWDVPQGAAILAAPGVSSLIARIPGLLSPAGVAIAGPTYNEHAAAFSSQGWQVNGHKSEARVVVHPNNPDGRFWGDPEPGQRLTIIDESFCDTTPHRSLIGFGDRPGTLILKSFGKFWGLAGLRLGFAIGDPELITELREALGPWPVSGPALAIGAAALSDPDWAASARVRLSQDSARLDQVMTKAGAAVVGGTSLFRLYQVPDASQWQTRLARSHIWSRIFPYSKTWLRLGLPAPDHWPQFLAAL